MENIYIFTEAFNCGLILKKCLESFFKYHKNIIVNVFGNTKDFEDIGFFENVNYIDLTSNQEVNSQYKRGHLGTAYIGSRVIKEYSEGNDYIIHFDSDVIFRKESLSLLTDKIKDGYDLIGPVRCYKNNMNGRTDLNNYNDVVQTYFYAFNKTKISNYDINTLQEMVVGNYNPLNHPILDYFDPVSFDILKNYGKIFFLDSDLVGGLTMEGNRLNKYIEPNKDMDFGENLIHFAGVGSGMSFYNNKNHAYQGYQDWSIKRFVLYYKLFYNEELNSNYDVVKYELLNKILNETNS